ncbi:hypothetical protein ABZ128_30800 [Streptomyces sp. NPDC006326]|uniref:hypothetical protein n=1 Tax=Streptomyces sp. NPDC006326 TaxID=3156752 RepID=UPI0033BE273A
MPPAPPPDPQAERRAGRAYSARFHLLDRQVVDGDGTSVAKVDDLELVRDEHGRLHVSAVLVGPTALAPRLGGRTGRFLAAVARRLRTGGTTPARIPIEQVTAVGAAVTAAPTAGAPGVHPLENWIRDNVITRLPGSGHASG